MGVISKEAEIYEDLILLLSTYFLQSKRINAKKHRKKKPRFRVNSYLMDRATKGRFFTDFQDMVNHPPHFKENFKMMPEQFQYIHGLIKPLIEAKIPTHPNDSISTEEKLAVTLEYLASGSLFRHIASCYRISKQHFGDIVDNCCDAIIKVLSEGHIPSLSRRFWIDRANRFNSRWNLPNCLAAIDGKHCSIKCPKNSGSLFYNHKGFYSIVLMGVADADYKFIYFDVGAYGSEGDSGVFRTSKFGSALFNKSLNLPEPQPVHGKLTPFYFVADDAFPLHKNIMKPYKPPTKSEPLPSDERIFNYRLSRARRTIENAFGIMCARWLCLARSMFVSPARAQKIITACCLLHNFLCDVAKDDYAPNGFADVILDDGTVQNGTWRNNLPDGSFYFEDIDITAGRPTETAKSVRNHLKSFVNSIEGSVSWQNNIALFL